MSLESSALIPALLVMALATAVTQAQERRVERPRPLPAPLPLRPSTLPAVENYATAAVGIFEIIAVQAAERVLRLRASDGKTVEVLVAEHVYDLSKLKAGDKLKVDFFQPDEENPEISAAGIWPVQPAR